MLTTFTLKRDAIQTQLGTRGSVPGVKKSLDLVIIEDESHVLYECGLYSQQRSKLISNLLKMPSIETEGEDPIGSLDVNEINLKDNLM